MENNKKIIGLIIIFVVVVAIVTFINTMHIEKNDKTTPKKYDCEFTRTYRVYGVYDSNDEKYKYITIRAYQDEDIETIKVLKEISDELIENQDYEIKFKQLTSILEDNIREIYQSSEIISIKKTDLTGLNQKQENFCTD